jgi:hypothetical protein
MRHITLGVSPAGALAASANQAESHHFTTTIYVSSSLLLLHMCPHPTIYMSKSGGIASKDEDTYVVAVKMRTHI